MPNTSRAILLVEDHADSAAALARLLTFEKHRVRVAHTCASALEIASSEKFDVFLIDIGLPDGDGCALLAELLKSSKGVGVAMTGYGMAEDICRGKAAGFKDYLVKPLRVEQVRDVLAKLPRSSADPSL